MNRVIRRVTEANGEPAVLHVRRPWWTEAWDAARARAAAVKVADRNISVEIGAPAPAVDARPSPASDVVGTVRLHTLQGGRAAVMPTRQPRVRFADQVAAGWARLFGRGPVEHKTGVPFRFVDQKQVPKGHPVLDRPVRVRTPRERVYE